MKQFFLIFFVSISIVVILLVFKHLDTVATINHHDFIVDIAKTDQEKEIGLAKYNFLPDDHGMYFPFDHADYYAFWMKNMKFPIDIIFFYHNRIVTIYPSVPKPYARQIRLPSYRSTSLSDGVLEINAGLSEKYNFHIGDTIQLGGFL